MNAVAEPVQEICTPKLQRFTSNGYDLDTTTAHFGELRASNDRLRDVSVLRERMDREGYLFFRGLLDRETVLDARREVAERLAKEGYLDPSEPLMNCVAAKNYKKSFMPEVTLKNSALRSVLYDGAMTEFFTRFLGGEIRHFDFTWFRAVAPGHGTASHCDIVYMGRGTKQLYTAWTPIGDVDFKQGGLMILESSNNNQRLRSTYGKMDVDTFCENKPGVHGWLRGGHLSRNPNHIRKMLGGRWLTTEYRAGDVLLFSAYTVHASLDNGSNQIRLSSDSRYQLASEPVDERWVGENPVGHGQAGKRGRIC